MDRRSPLLAPSPTSLRTDDPPARERSVVFRYGVAVVTTMVALVFKLALGPVILPSFYVPFYGAVLVSAWVGGVGPGIVASVLSFGIGQVLFSPPLAPPPGNAPLATARDVLFLFVAIGWSWGTAALHASQRRVAEVLQAARDELEARVAVRTAELGETNRQLTDEIARRAEAEEQFRQAFQDAPIGMALVGFDGLPFQVNRALCAMLGYTEAELLVRSVADCTHPDDMPAATEQLRRLLAGDRTAYPLEKRYIHKLGHIVWASLNVSLVRDAAGRPLHVISQVEDITERKRASQELHESESKFRTLTETINTAACIFQGEAVRYVNPAASRITGFTQDELLAMNFWDVIHPDCRDLFRERGLARQRGDPVPPEDEVMILTKSGQIRWVDFTACSIEFEGRPAVLGTAVDITERKRATELLRQSEQRFSGAFAYAPIGMALVRMDGQPLQINQALCDMLGYTPEELGHKPVADMMHPDDMPAALLDRERLSAGKVARYEAERRYFHKSGRVVWTQMSVSLVRDAAGQPLYLVSHLQDVTDRRQAEAALREERNFASAILDTVGALVGVVDRDGRIVRCNWMCEQTLGFTATEALGRYFWELMPVAEEAQAAERMFPKLLAGQWPRQYDNYWFTRKGTRRLLTWSTTFLYDADGAIAYVIGSGIDITERKQAEEALRKSEERYALAVAGAKDGLWDWNLETNELYLSPRCASMLSVGDRVAADDWRVWREQLHPDDHEAVATAVTEHLKGVTPHYEIEHRLRLPDGGHRWVLARGLAVRDASGKPYRFAGSLTDISERKHAEDMLRESEERFRGTFAQAAVGIAHVAPDGRWLRVNRRLCDIVGYSEQELLAKSFQDITHGDDLDTDLGHVREMLDGNIQTYSMEKRYVRKDGSEVWIDLTVSLVREPSGAPKYFISVVQDIGERKRAEAALRRAQEELEDRVKERTAQLAAANRALQQEIIQRQEAAVALRDSEQRFRAIFDQAAVGVSQMGIDGRYLLVNQRMCDILGYSREELLERGFRDVTYPDDVEASVQRMRAVEANETGSFNLEKRYLRKDGSVIWVSLTASAIRDVAGNVRYGIGIVQDISERKRAEAELDAANQRIRTILEEISDGFYTLDHEGRFTYVNPSALQLFQLPAEQLLGKRFFDAFPEGIATTFHDEYERLMTERRRVDLEAYYAPRNRWFRVRGYPTQHGLSVLFEDVTERHEKEVSVVNDILRALNAHLDVADAFPMVAVGLRQLTGCERSSVAVFEDGDEWIRVMALDQPRAYLREGVRFRVADVPAAQDALEGRTHIVRDLATERQFPSIGLLYAAGYRSRLSVPLHGRERVLGVLNLL